MTNALDPDLDFDPEPSPVTSCPDACRPTSRRRFLKTSAATAAAAGAWVPGPAAGVDEDSESDALKSNPLCVFNKPLQHLGYEEQADLVAEIGFTGIEGTVRKRGHVEPERVEEDLPRQMEALRSRGLEMTLMTTDVDGADSEIHRRVLRTGADLGVKRFRMGSIRYSPDRSIPEQLDEIRSRFLELAEFCRPLGIRPLYQNHAGNRRFGAALWDLHSVLADVEGDAAGTAFDIRHATVEGGESWPTEFHLVRPHFGVVYCKDFAWKEGERRAQNVPLGTGRVDYPRFLSLLRESSYDGPISLHVEYIDHRDPKLLEDSIAAIERDRKRLLELMGGEA